MLKTRQRSRQFKRMSKRSRLDRILQHGSKKSFIRILSWANCFNPSSTKPASSTTCTSRAQWARSRTLRSVCRRFARGQLLVQVKTQLRLRAIKSRNLSKIWSSWTILSRLSCHQRSQSLMRLRFKSKIACSLRLKNFRARHLVS